MSEAELKTAAEAISKELAPFIKLGRMIKWLTVTTLTLVFSIGAVAIWVNGVNQASAANQKAIMDTQQAMVVFENQQANLLKSHEQESAAREKENRTWQVEKDALLTKLVTTQELAMKILDRHENFIEAHGWPDVQHPH
jgi:hypothetical protein